MLADEHARNPSPRPLTVRLVRAVLGLVLLLGPLLAVELTMRAQAQWLRPVLRKFDVWIDMKLLLIEHREGCPDFVSFGTSLAGNSLPPRYLARKKLGGKTIRDPFDFAAAEVRATTVLAQYRWLRQRRCEPTWIAIEVSPIIINGEHGGHTHDAAVMSARAQLGMPDGFAALRGYSIAQQLELATYDRLLIHRRRRQIAKRTINHFEAERWFMTVDERAKAKDPKRMDPDPKLELDGKLNGLRKSLTTRTWAREQGRRRSTFRRGNYKWWFNEPEQQAMFTLVREAAADGVVVILHAPPVTDLYHSEVAPKLGMAQDFASFTQELAALADEHPKVVWHDAFADTSYRLADFADWVHLSKRGAKRYVKELLQASSASLRAERN
jgi:hypothetical protein